MGLRAWGLGFGFSGFGPKRGRLIQYRDHVNTPHHRREREIARDSERESERECEFEREGARARERARARAHTTALI